MWLGLSLLSGVTLIVMLSAGLLWPILWQDKNKAAFTMEKKARWFTPWWRYWLYLTSPLLSWRHKQRLQYLTSQTGQSVMGVEQVFAQQCLAFVLGLALSVVLVGRLGLNLLSALPLYVAFSVALYWYPVYLLRRHIGRQQLQLQRDFPFMLDLLTLSIEAGMGLLSALQLCVRQLPPHALKRHLHTTLDDLRTGLSREQAFTRFAERTDLDEAYAFVAALQQSFELGGSLGPLLRQQAEQRRQERFLRAEKKALEAPVKMLLPLVVCIFPCTFLVIGYPLFFQLSQNI